VPEYRDPNLRELICHNYRVVYRVLEDAVEVASIIHAARPLKDMT